jgi:hypothetical protein
MNMIEHKHGGVVTPTHLGHNTDDKGVPYWYVKGDVKWSDGSESKGLEIAPYALCHGEDSADFDALLEKMSDYLRTAGNYIPPTRIRGGYIIHWKPAKEKHAEVAL